MEMVDAGPQTGSSLGFDSKEILERLRRLNKQKKELPYELRLAVEKESEAVEHSLNELQERLAEIKVQKLRARIRNEPETGETTFAEQQVGAELAEMAASLDELESQVTAKLEARQEKPVVQEPKAEDASSRAKQLSHAFAALAEQTKGQSEEEKKSAFEKRLEKAGGRVRTEELRPAKPKAVEEKPVIPQIQLKISEEGTALVGAIKKLLTPKPKEEKKEERVEAFAPRPLPGLSEALAATIKTAPELKAQAVDQLAKEFEKQKTAAETKKPEKTVAPAEAEEREAQVGEERFEDVEAQETGEASWKETALEEAFEEKVEEKGAVEEWPAAADESTPEDVYESRRRAEQEELLARRRATAVGKLAFLSRYEEQEGTPAEKKFAGRREVLPVVVVEERVVETAPAEKIRHMLEEARLKKKEAHKQLALERTREEATNKDAAEKEKSRAADEITRRIEEARKARLAAKMGKTLEDVEKEEREKRRKLELAEEEAVLEEKEEDFVAKTALEKMVAAKKAAGARPAAAPEAEATRVIPATRVESVRFGKAGEKPRAVEEAVPAKTAGGVEVLKLGKAAEKVEAMTSRRAAEAAEELTREREAAEAKLAEAVEKEIVEEKAVAPPAEPEEVRTAEEKETVVREVKVARTEKARPVEKETVQELLKHEVRDVFAGLAGIFRRKPVVEKAAEAVAAGEEEPEAIVRKTAERKEEVAALKKAVEAAEPVAPAAGKAPEEAEKKWRAEYLEEEREEEKAEGYEAVVELVAPAETAGKPPLEKAVEEEKAEEALLEKAHAKKRKKYENRKRLLEKQLFAFQQKFKQQRERLKKALAEEKEAEQEWARARHRLGELKLARQTGKRVDAGRLAKAKNDARMAGNRYGLAKMMLGAARKRFVAAERTAETTARLVAELEAPKKELSGRKKGLAEQLHDLLAPHAPSDQERQRIVDQWIERLEAPKMTAEQFQQRRLEQLVTDLKAVAPKAEEERLGDLVKKLLARPVEKPAAGAGEAARNLEEQRLKARHERRKKALGLQVEAAQQEFKKRRATFLKAQAEEKLLGQQALRARAEVERARQLLEKKPSPKARTALSRTVATAGTAAKKHGLGKARQVHAQKTLRAAEKELEENARLLAGLEPQAKPLVPTGKGIVEQLKDLLAPHDLTEEEKEKIARQWVEVLEAPKTTQKQFEEKQLDHLLKDLQEVAPPVEEKKLRDAAAEWLGLWRGEEQAARTTLAAYVAGTAPVPAGMRIANGLREAVDNLAKAATLKPSAEKIEFAKLQEEEKRMEEEYAGLEEEWKAAAEARRQAVAARREARKKAEIEKAERLRARHEAKMAAAARAREAGKIRLAAIRQKKAAARKNVETEEEEQEAVVETAKKIVVEKLAGGITIQMPASAVAPFARIEQVQLSEEDRRKIVDQIVKQTQFQAGQPTIVVQAPPTISAIPAPAQQPPALPAQTTMQPTILAPSIAAPATATQPTTYAARPAQQTAQTIVTQPTTIYATLPVTVLPTQITTARPGTIPATAATLPTQIAAAQPVAITTPAITQPKTGRQVIAQATAPETVSTVQQVPTPAGGVRKLKVGAPTVQISAERIAMPGIGGAAVETMAVAEAYAPEALAELSAELLKKEASNARRELRMAARPVKTVAAPQAAGVEVVGVEEVPGAVEVPLPETPVSEVFGEMGLETLAERAPRPLALPDWKRREAVVGEAAPGEALLEEDEGLQKQLVEKIEEFEKTRRTAQAAVAREQAAVRELSVAQRPAAGKKKIVLQVARAAKKKVEATKTARVEAQEKFEAARTAREEIEKVVGEQEKRRKDRADALAPVMGPRLEPAPAAQAATPGRKDLFASLQGLLKGEGKAVLAPPIVEKRVAAGKEVAEVEEAEMPKPPEQPSPLLDLAGLKLPAKEGRKEVAGAAAPRVSEEELDLSKTSIAAPLAGGMEAAEETAEVPRPSVEEAEGTAVPTPGGGEATVFEESVLEEESRLPTLKTQIDEVCHFLEQQPDHKADLDAVAAKFGWAPEKVEKIGKVLGEKGILQLEYPVSIFAKPEIILVGTLPEVSQKELRGNRLLSSYDLEADGVPGKIRIWDVKNQARPLYSVSEPAVGSYTEVFLEYLRDELAREVPIETEEIADPKKLNLLKDRFYKAADEILKKELPGLAEETQKILAGVLLHRIYGLGRIELLMSDDMLEEIAVNSATEPISVYHRAFGWLQTNLVLPSEEEIYNYAAQIGRKSGRDITLLSPIMDAALLTGDRVAATLFPISSLGNTITIRRFAHNPWTLVHLIDPRIHTMDAEMAAFLWLCMQYEMNVVVAGGTASGKTSTLNTFCALIPSAHRIITIEDTRELQLPEYLKWNWIALRTRGQNPEGKGEVSMLDLMVASLRMRPDRIVVGEVRRQNEAQVLFEAMHTGHAVYSTIHADTAAQVVRRLTEPPISVPMTELESLQLIVVQYRDRRTGKRRTYEMAELMPSSRESKEISLNVLYRWKPRTDSFEKMAESSRIFADLNMHTGLTVEEIKADLEDKKAILEWMLRNKINNVDLVGNVMNIYYKNPARIAEAARKNLAPSEVL